MRRRRRHRAVGIGLVLAAGCLLFWHAGRTTHPTWWHQRRVVGLGIDPSMRLHVADSENPQRTTRVRLLGLAPGDDAALAWLSDRCVGRTLTLSIQSAHQAGRTPAAYVYGPRGTLLNREAIVAGATTTGAADPHRLSAWFARARSLEAADRRSYTDPIHGSRP